MGGAQKVMESDFASSAKDWWGELDKDTQYNISQIIAPAGEALLDVAPAGIFGRATSLFRKAAEAPDFSRVAREAEQGSVQTAARIANETIEPAEREVVINKLARSYEDALVENRQSINNKLDDLATMASRADAPVTGEQLIRDLAEAGIVPDIAGQLADFRTDMNFIKTRQSELMQELQPLIDQVQDTIEIDDLYAQMRQQIVSDPRMGSQIKRGLNELDNIFDGYRIQYGQRPLTANDINNIKLEANQKRNDFAKSNQGDLFVADTYANIARGTNDWLNTRIDDELFKATNAEWGRLQRIYDTADVLNNQRVDVGILGRTLGSYVTTVAGSSAGLSIAGPGGLVIAGILAKMGGDAVADMMRKVKFSPELRDKIRSAVSQDEALKSKLMDTASTENQKRLSQLLLPAPGETARRSEIGSGKAIEVGGETPEGRVEPGGTERVREGAIKQPDSSGGFTEQARRFNTPEAFVEAVNNNPSWKAKLAKFGVTPEEIAKLAFGSGLIGLVAYQLDSPEAGPLGLLTIVGMAAPTPGRSKIIKALAKNLPDDDFKAMSNFVDGVKGGAISLKGERLSFKDTKGISADTAEAAYERTMKNVENVPEMADMSPDALVRLFDEVMKEADTFKKSEATTKQPREKNGQFGEKPKGTPTRIEIGDSVTYDGDTYIVEAQKGVSGDKWLLTNEFGGQRIVDKSNDALSKQGVSQKELGYGMSHRPSKSGSGFDITDSEAMPKDFYDNPQQYVFGNEEASQESIRAILKIHNKPDADVVVYRASPKNELNDGDWISLSKKYAKGESLDEGVPVNKFTVKAKDIQFAGDDINEFGYFPTD